MTRLLIIDDEPSLTRLLKLALERQGEYDVRTANTGKAGLVVAREFQPHVVVLDLVLPDLSGGEVCAALGDAPVIFLTALVPSARNIAGRAVLAKPVRLDTLVASLEVAIRQSATPLAQ
jgi:two-component system, OmpR family, response regulator